jgi:hypothetical protein
VTIFGLVDSVYYFALPRARRSPQQPAASRTALRPRRRPAPDSIRTSALRPTSATCTRTPAIRTVSRRRPTRTISPRFTAQRRSTTSPSPNTTTPPRGFLPPTTEISSRSAMPPTATATSWAIFGQEWGLAADGHVNIFEAPGCSAGTPGTTTISCAERLFGALHRRPRASAGLVSGRSASSVIRRRATSTAWRRPTTARR